MDQMIQLGAFHNSWWYLRKDWSAGARMVYGNIYDLPGDLGTFDGLRANGHAQVLDCEGRPIPGLYAVGNDMASIMGGNYPGGGITLGPAITFGYIAARHLAGADRAGTDFPKAA